MHTARLGAFASDSAQIVGKVKKFIAIDSDSLVQCGTFLEFCQYFNIMKKYEKIPNILGVFYKGVFRCFKTDIKMKYKYLRAFYLNDTELIIVEPNFVMIKYNKIVKQARMVKQVRMIKYIVIVKQTNIIKADVIMYKQKHAKHTMHFSWSTKTACCQQVLRFHLDSQFNPIY
ncbi:Hypothetical_protein [Hexamita inflata]|uniref:Hypothetical_protein n=1 Tax=Hexamita inflata TaxID=28002 RepID=A0AA86U4S5_9EUKA|nr:Hypothetical protein HINF_LOCUS28454 [Hexamita inflata]